MAKESIIIIDYGAGNVRSVAKAFEHVIERAGLNADVKLSAEAEDIAKASRLVLPGQGAFGDCMSALKRCDGVIEALESAVLVEKTPFLGICVGMQLLVTQGYEHGTHDGLGWIKGHVRAIEPADKALKVPHMGWNEVELTDQGASHFVLRNTENRVKPDNHYYFVHSFMVESEEQEYILGHTPYGEHMPVIIGRDNIMGVQFHPEKSQDNGLNLIERFLKWTI